MKPRVVRIIARLNVGGPAIHAVLLTEGLAGRGWEATLVTGAVGGAEGDMSYYASRKAVSPLVLPGLGNRAGPLEMVRTVSSLYRLLRRLRPHVVHTHTTKAGAVGRTAALLHNAVSLVKGGRRARIVHTFHGHVFAGYFSGWLSRLLVRAERLFARFTDRIVTVSETMRCDLVQRYRIAPAEKVSVVPLGFDFEWVSDVAAKTGVLRGCFGIPPGVATVGVVGRLTAIKNHTLLFAALGRMTQADTRLVVVGDGERRSALEQEVRARGLSARVIFAGWQRGPAKIYADLDLVSISSRNEGTPVALIEAMAAGRAFVSTRVGGVADLVVGEGRPHHAGFEVYANGILVPPDDPAVLAAALDFLVSRPEMRRAMGAAGQAYVLKQFARERLLDDIEAIYGRLMDGGKEV